MPQGLLVLSRMSPICSAAAAAPAAAAVAVVVVVVVVVMVVVWLVVLLRCILQPSDYSSFLIRLGAKHRQIGVVFTFFRDARSKKHPKYRCFWYLRSQQPRYLRCFFCGQHLAKALVFTQFSSCCNNYFFCKRHKIIINYTNKQQKIHQKASKIDLRADFDPQRENTTWRILGGGSSSHQWAAKPSPDKAWPSWPIDPWRKIQLVSEKLPQWYLACGSQAPMATLLSIHRCRTRCCHPALQNVSRHTETTCQWVKDGSAPQPSCVAFFLLPLTFSLRFLASKFSCQASKHCFWHQQQTSCKMHVPGCQASKHCFWHQQQTSCKMHVPGLQKASCHTKTPSFASSMCCLALGACCQLFVDTCLLLLLLACSLLALAACLLLPYLACFCCLLSSCILLAGFLRLHFFHSSCLLLQFAFFLHLAACFLLRCRACSCSLLSTFNCSSTLAACNLFSDALPLAVGWVGGLLG